MAFVGESSGEEDATEAEEKVDETVEEPIVAEGKTTGELDVATAVPNVAHEVVQSPVITNYRNSCVTPVISRRHVLQSPWRMQAH